MTYSSGERGAKALAETQSRAQAGCMDVAKVALTCGQATIESLNLSSESLLLVDSIDPTSKQVMRRGRTSPASRPRECLRKACHTGYLYATFSEPTLH